jgi:hypothetical protein
MNLADAVVSAGVALTSSVVIWAVKALWSRDRDSAAAHKDHVEAEARYQEAWREDYDHAYRQVKSQCDECLRKMDRIADAFYGLLDDLEEQIMPMLMLPHDPGDTSRAVRAMMRKARDAARDVTAG